jgi:hypothetical protein
MINQTPPRETPFKTTIISRSEKHAALIEIQCKEAEGLILGEE